MSRYGYFLWVVFLGLAAITSACGSNPQREIETITVSPSSADAQDYPDGQVPFVATGTFSEPPVTVSPLQATWVAVDAAGQRTTDVSITNSGVAQCTSGAPGTYTLGAWAVLLIPPQNSCNVVTPFGNPCGDSVIGFAQLTCP
jgi:hypothetical protein